MNGWIVLAFAIAVPGLLQLYSAWCIRPFLRMRAGLFTFLLCFSGGVFETLFALILVAIIVLGGSLVIELDLSNVWVLLTTIFSGIAFFFWRALVSLHSLWLAGIVHEDWFMKVAPEKKKG